MAWVSLSRDRIDSFVLGRLLGAIAVGQYAIARDLGFVTSTERVLPICRALFPGLTQVRSRGSDVGDAYFGAISGTLVLALPPSVGIVLIADPLIRLEAGPRSVAAMPLPQIFLRMWREFFPHATIWGLDILDKSAHAGKRINILRGSQNDADFLRSAAAQIGRIDIIDDGRHINEHVLTSFGTLFSLLAPAGSTSSRTWRPRIIPSLAATDTTSTIRQP